MDNKEYNEIKVNQRQIKVDTTYLRTVILTASCLYSTVKISYLFKQRNGINQTFLRNGNGEELVIDGMKKWRRQQQQPKTNPNKSNQSIIFNDC